MTPEKLLKQVRRERLFREYDKLIIGTSERFDVLEAKVPTDINYYYHLDDELCILLRTSYELHAVASFIRDIFAKIFEFEVEFLEPPDSLDMLCPENIYNELMERKISPEYIIVMLKLRYRDNFSPEMRAYLLYYTIHLLLLLDWFFCVNSGSRDTTIYTACDSLRRGFNSNLLYRQHLFFHKGIFNVLFALHSNLNSNKYHPECAVNGFYSLFEHLEGIVYVFQSRKHLKRVLETVKDFDPTLITESIFTQYETLRRNF